MYFLPWLDRGARGVRPAGADLARLEHAFALRFRLAPYRPRLVGLALLIALAFAVALTLILRIAWDFRRELVPNGFGLCRGWSEEERVDSPDLGGFLHGSSN